MIAPVLIWTRRAKRGSRGSERPARRRESNPARSPMVRSPDAIELPGHVVGMLQPSQIIHILCLAVGFLVGFLSWDFFLDLAPIFERLGLDQSVLESTVAKLFEPRRRIPNRRGARTGRRGSSRLRGLTANDFYPVASSSIERGSAQIIWKSKTAVG